MQRTLTKLYIVLFYLALGGLSWGIVSLSVVTASTGTNGVGSTGATGVKFTEIMYAPKGPDAKHEWVEVCNFGTSAVDIRKWRFYENKTNHGLSLSMGSGTLAKNGCAVIADDAKTFKNDNSSFSGVLFDSTFSLNNTGETIALKNATGKVIDTATYKGTLGAKNDGNSLHKQGTTFVPGVPTPGVETGIISSVASGTQVSSASGTANNTATDVTTYTYDSVKIEPPQDIFIRVPKTMHTTVRALTTFTMESYDATGKSLTDGTVYWAFGDGASSRERAPIHVFDLPGTYAVRVTLHRKALMDTKEIVVTVAPLDATIRVAQDGSWVALKNNSTHELDVSRWRLVSGGQYFSIPDETYILPQGEVRFPREITKLTNVLVTKDVWLVYPQGGMALSSRQESIVAQAAKVIATQDKKQEGTTTISRLVVQPKKETKTISTQKIVTSSPSAHVVRRRRAVSKPIPVRATSRAPIKNKKATSRTDISTTSTQQTAAVVLSNTSETNTSQWYAALVALLAVASGGMLIARRRKLVVDGYTIVEQQKQQDE